MTWWNLSWTKKKAITLLGGASGAQSSYQVKLTVAWESSMKSDFSDLRFLNADEDTLLDSWLEEYTSETSATVWMETDTPANTVEARFFMYYGNSGAPSAWDGDATFPSLFDDFEDGNTTGWTDAMDTFEASTDQAKHGTHSLKTQSNTWQYGYYPITSINYPIACDMYIYPTANNKTIQFGLASASVADRTNAVYAYMHTDGKIWSYDGSTLTDWGVNYNANQWYHIRLVVYPATDTFDAYVDNMVTPVQTGLDTWGTLGGTIQSFYVICENSTQYHDSKYIHKYVVNPATNAFGS